MALVTVFVFDVRVGPELPGGKTQVDEGEFSQLIDIISDILRNVEKSRFEIDRVTVFDRLPVRFICVPDELFVITDLIDVRKDFQAVSYDADGLYLEFVSTVVFRRGLDVVKGIFVIPVGQDEPFFALVLFHIGDDAPEHRSKIRNVNYHN